MIGRASAPAKTILFGEHAVVYGKPAIVTAIDKRATVTAEKRADRALYIKSRELGDCVSQLNGDFPKEFRPIQVAVLESLKYLGEDCGLNIYVESDIPMAAGLGSSAAVSVATIAAVMRLFNVSIPPDTLSSIAYKCEETVHFKPSGVDNYIAAHGGLIVFRAGGDALKIKTDEELPLLIVNSMIKRSTGKMVKQVYDLRAMMPEVVDSIMNSIEVVVLRAKKALERGDLEELGLLMNANHELLSSLGLSNKTLDMIVNLAKEHKAMGAKITGAGGGGCVVILARDTAHQTRLVKVFRNMGFSVLKTKSENKGVL